jgi:hypothetical protein
MQGTAAAPESPSMQPKVGARACLQCRQSGAPCTAPPHFTSPLAGGELIKHCRSPQNVQPRTKLVPSLGRTQPHAPGSASSSAACTSASSAAPKKSNAWEAAGCGAGRRRANQGGGQPGQAALLAAQPCREGAGPWRGQRLSRGHLSQPSCPMPGTSRSNINNFAVPQVKRWGKAAQGYRRPALLPPETAYAPGKGRSAPAAPPQPHPAPPPAGRLQETAFVVGLFASVRLRG